MDRRRAAWPLVVWIVALGLIVSSGAFTGSTGGVVVARAQEADGPAWQGGGRTTGGPNRLHTPASGALFASGPFFGLQRSNDGGRTWRSVPTVTPPAKRASNDVVDVVVAFDPNNHQIAYYGGHDGLYKTSDDALRWRKVAPVDGFILQVGVSAADPNLVYFALEAPRGTIQLWRSRDGGESWDQLPNRRERPGGECLWHVPVLQPHPADASRVFFQAYCAERVKPTATTLLLSADQGESWTAVHQEPTDFYSKLVGGQGADPNRFYVVVNRLNEPHGFSFLRSDDGGQTWTSVWSTTGSGASTVTYDPTAPDRVYLGAQFSADGGATWRFITSTGLDSGIDDLVLGVDGRHLYAAGLKGVFWLPLSEDGIPPFDESLRSPEMAPGSGQRTWARAEPATAWEQTRLTDFIEELIVTDGDVAFAREYDGTLHRSDDGGTTWARVDAPTKLHTKAVAVDPSDPSAMYVMGDDGLYKTENNARTWRRLVSPRAEARKIAVSPADRSLVYVSTGGGPSRLSRSRDGGDTWEVLQEAPLRGPADPQGCGWWTWLLVPHPTDANRVFAATGCFQNDRGPRSGLKHSADQGATWADVFDDPDNFPKDLVGGRGPDPSRFYLLAGDRLLRSDDDAQTWTELLVNGMTALAYDPANPDRVFIGLGTSGAMMSVDGGVTWIDLGQVGDGLPIYDLALAGDGQTLYAGTTRGVWRLRPPG